MDLLRTVTAPSLSQLLVETNNTCVFDNEHLLQLHGTARGTVFSRTYANLSIEYHEAKLYTLAELNYNLDIR